MIIQDIINKLQHFASFLPFIGLTLVAVVAAIFLIKATLRLVGLRQLFRRKVIYFEITPLAFTDKSPKATQQLFSVLHGLGGHSWRDKLMMCKTVFSLEMAASREQGIRYILAVPEREAASYHKAITGYLPEISIKEIKDYLPAAESGTVTKVVSFKQTGNFAFSLQPQTALDKYDPIAHITSAMTKLETREFMALQFVLTPAHIPEAEAISNDLLRNEDVLAKLRGQSGSALTKIFSIINKLLFIILDNFSSWVNGLMGGSSYSSGYSAQREAHERMQIANRLKPARQLSNFEQKLVESVNNKVRQPLYIADIRVLVIANTKQEAKQRIKDIKAALASFSVPKYQSLALKRQLPTKLSGKYAIIAFQKRLPAVSSKSSNILAVSEIADLYHFPHSDSAKTENVVKSLSRTLPAPLSLKTQTDFDILLGQNIYHGVVAPIGLTSEERERHVYIIGGTGNGKTTMLLYAMVQDIRNGKGLAVIDPHGDLAETVLKYIPEERLNDVIYFNPDDIGYPIGMNLLEIPAHLTGDDLLREKDLVTEATVSVFRKIFSDDDTGGHRIEYILRNAVQTALTLEKPTLFTVFELLTDPDYRKEVVSNLEDDHLRNFWKHELGRAGDFQRVKMSAGITSKIGRFLFSASAKRILEQPKSTIDFEDIINSGKILICNFSKGLLGEDTSALFGITLLAKLQIATLKRARLTQEERQPFYLYADEFQNFATMSFVQLLSEARKYKLFLLMAEQSTSQLQERRMVDIILANVGTVVCFRTGNPADEKLLLPMFAPYVEAGDISYLPSFKFYIRIAAVKSQEPLSGETILLQDSGSQKIAERVIALSRASHGEKYIAPLPKPKPTPKKNTKSVAKYKKQSKKPTTETTNLQPVKLLK